MLKDKSRYEVPVPLGELTLHPGKLVSTPADGGGRSAMELHIVKSPGMRPYFAAQHSKPSKKPSYFSESEPLAIQKLSKKDLSRVLRTEAAIKAIDRKANSSKYNNLWPKAVLEALEDAIRTNNWESALKIFDLLRRQHWYQPRCQTYAKLLVMLGKCKQARQASLLFEIMHSDGLQPTLDVYTALVSAYGFSGLLDKALEIVDAMKSIPDCKPDVYTYSVLIKCCTKFGRLDMIPKLLEDMSGLGIECNVVTYNTIIDGYGKAELFELMESTLTDMIESGECHPDVFSLNSVIGAYGRSGQIALMEKWFEEFLQMGVEPDVMSYNILIRSYGKAGVYQKIGSIVEFMRKRFYSPTIVTYNILIERFGKAGDIAKMDEIFLKMKHQGMKPNSITYCSLVSAYGKAGRMHKVDSILRQVENSDVVLDTPFFNSVISAYGHAGCVDKMLELFKVMKEKGCKPDNITVATMAQAYRAQGMTENANVLESKMVIVKEN